MNLESVAALEALLFASDAPLPVERLAEVLELPMEETRGAVEVLRSACEAPGRGLALVEVGGGVRLVTRPKLAGVLVRLQRLRLKSRLSRAALETLAIIAYRSPVTRAVVEAVRGVNSDHAVATLLARGLIDEVGRAPGPGRPVLFAPAVRFLEYFGLQRTDDLPPLPPMEEGLADLTEAAQHAVEALEEHEEHDLARAD